MILIHPKFQQCIAFRNKEVWHEADPNKLFVAQTLGWIGFLAYERFTKSGLVILSSDFRLKDSSYTTSINQKRKGRYYHTVYPSMVLAAKIGEIK